MLTDNFRLLRQEDTVKFVSGSRDDLERAADIISEYDLTKRCHVYISPVFGKIDPQVIVDFMKEKKMNDVRLQLQLHKLIWEPDRRGV
jgi:7-carboxy-7-deazaguanine synthase